MKFKKGDEVRFIGTMGYDFRDVKVMKGEIFTISHARVYTDGTNIYEVKECRCDEKPRHAHWLHMDEEFELVEKKKAVKVAEVKIDWDNIRSKPK